MVADMEVADKVAHMVDNWTFDQSDEETCLDQRIDKDRVKDKYI